MARFLKPSRGHTLGIPKQQSMDLTGAKRKSIFMAESKQTHSIDSPEFLSKTIDVPTSDSPDI